MVRDPESRPVTPGDVSLRDGLVAEYLFAGNADDTSGHAHHGVVHGARPTADRFGRADHAYAFDGVHDHIVVAPPPRLRADQLSLSVWVRHDERDFEGWTNCIVAQDDGNDEDQSRRVFQLSTDHGHVVWHRMVCARDPMCKRRVRAGAWTHIAVVHDHGVNRLHVDGTLHDTVEHALRTHPEQPLHLGRKGTPEPYFFFRGAIDDLRIWERALRDAEVAALHREGGWQAPAAPPLPADPVSGRWGQEGVVFLDLRYDGARTVSGRIMGGRPDNMAAIRIGTFDRAASRLRLEGEAKHPRTGCLVHWVIEGMPDGDEVTVSAVFDGDSGNYILSRHGARPRLTRRSVRSQLGALSFQLRRWLGGGR